MANEEHLKILRQGVEVWNRWRKDNPNIKPNLRGAYLKRANLHKGNFSEAILHEADLRWADLGSANLQRAILSESYLSEANLFNANLQEANLMEATLSSTCLIDANLTRANFSYANLVGAILYDAKFHGAKFVRARLMGQDLSDADLSHANFQNAYLMRAQLINAKLDGANLTDAGLWETQRAHWSIKNVICESAYWDEWAETKTLYQRGDFERLFSEQNKIKLFYKDGANLLEIAALPSIIKNLEEKHPGCKLSFQSIEETPDGAIATLVLEESKEIVVEEVEAIRATIQADAECNIEALRYALNSKDKDIAQLQIEVKTLDRIIDKFIKETTGKKVTGDTYNISGQVGAAGRDALVHDNTLNQIVNAENSEVKTQIQGNRNAAIDGDISDDKISTGNENEKDGESG
jgi:uncharacterized protein YjbI with pentapeptide repeats